MAPRFRTSASKEILRNASSYWRDFSSASASRRRESSSGFTERLSRSSNVRRIGRMRIEERMNARTITRQS